MIQEESFDAHSRNSQFGNQKLIPNIDNTQMDYHKPQLHCSHSQDNRVFGKFTTHVQTDFIDDQVDPLPKEGKQLVPLK